MTIQQVYEKYHIMPQLQLHQLRVAAVATQIVQHSSAALNLNEIQAACLLHDMGNIIKFQLNLFPEFLNPEGLEYWQSVKENFILKYGRDENKATLIIAEDINVSGKIQTLLKSFGISHSQSNLESNDLDKMICCYSDQRVTPREITSLEARILEGKERFKQNKNVQESDSLLFEHKFQQMVDSMMQIEHKIFVENSIQPVDITEQSSKYLIEELREFTL